MPQFDGPIAAMLKATGATPPVVTVRKGILTVARTSAGIFVVTLEGGGMADADSVEYVCSHGAIVTFGIVVVTSATVRTLNFFSDAGAATDPTAFSYMCFNCRV